MTSSLGNLEGDRNLISYKPHVKVAIDNINKTM